MPKTLLDPTAALEAAWVQLCTDAGWTPSLYGTTDLRARRAYEARLDALAAEREPELRRLIAEARERSRGVHLHYVEGIEAALVRAIAEPRTAEAAP